ncbi:hypothetical protein FA15DRAFT_656668 [Coprinopsis marcescibilis]|uniref:Uncharacterized protein n=1 Tax=Coprinopsis marcescibilis TaxID=230819 RepID=A0A5C3KSC2_COPMA|nr:hypothetical protein FA15DRAFT_656668 [Coprinopsis marcescibilis]
MKFPCVVLLLSILLPVWSAPIPDHVVFDQIEARVPDKSVLSLVLRHSIILNKKGQPIDGTNHWAILLTTPDNVQSEHGLAISDANALDSDRGKMFYRETVTNYAIIRDYTVSPIIAGESGTTDAAGLKSYIVNIMKQKALGVNGSPGIEIIGKETWLNCYDWAINVLETLADKGVVGFENWKRRFKALSTGGSDPSNELPTKAEVHNLTKENSLRVAKKAVEKKSKKRGILSPQAQAGPRRPIGKGTVAKNAVLGKVPARPTKPKPFRKQAAKAPGPPKPVGGPRATPTRRK